MSNVYREFKAKKMLMACVILLLAISTAVLLLARHFAVFKLCHRHRGDILVTAVWEDKGPTPLGEKGYTPQGMTWANGKIIFANTWKDTRSRIDEIEPENMKILRTFDMVDGACHASGLAWDGKYL